MLKLDKGKLLLPGSILLGILLFAALNIWIVNAFSFKVGTFNIDKIFKDSVVGQDLNSQVQKKVNETKAKLTTAKTTTGTKPVEKRF